MNFSTPVESVLNLAVNILWVFVPGPQGEKGKDGITGKEGELCHRVHTSHILNAGDLSHKLPVKII